jgi:hypothetical protein
LSTSFYDVSIWEEIRSIVCWKTDRLVEGIHKEIPKDTALAELQGKRPIPWQLREVVQQRAETWVQRVYDICCNVYKDRGKAASEDFDRAVWAYCVEPFIMGQQEADIHHETMSGFLELLLCAVGSPREKRRSLTVSQKDCCLQVRTNVFDIWNARLHHRPSRMDEAVAALSRHNQIEARARRIVTGLPPDSPPLQPPTQTPLVAQPAAPTPPHAAPVSSLPQGSISEGLDGLATSVRSSALEPVLPSELDTGRPRDGTAPSHAMTKKTFPSPLPSATIIGANINEFVAWDGEGYVLRPTKESVLADEGLKLIGSVRELSRIQRFSPGYVFVQNPSQEALCPDCTLQDPPAQTPSLARPIAPMPPQASRLSSVPQGSPSARADGSSTLLPPSALEPVLPPSIPTQEGPEPEPQTVSASDMITQSSGAGTATWENIEISFLSDERIQIRNGTVLETRNYGEFGFEDGRSGKPNQAWVTLRALAEERGLIQAPTKAHRDWSRVEKRIQEIRKVLRNHFGISHDPIPYVEGTGYRALFKIDCRPSYET